MSRLVWKQVRITDGKGHVQLFSIDELHPVPTGNKDKDFANTHKKSSVGASDVHVTVRLDPSDPRCHSPFFRMAKRAEFSWRFKEGGVYCL